MRRNYSENIYCLPQLLELLFKRGGMTEKEINESFFRFSSSLSSKRPNFLQDDMVLDLCKVYLNSNLDLSAKNNQGTTIIEVISKKFPAMLIFMVETHHNQLFDFINNFINSSQQNLLHVILSYQASLPTLHNSVSELIKILSLKIKISLNLLDKNSLTPLMICANTSSLHSLIPILLSSSSLVYDDVDLTVCDQYGDSVISLFVKSGLDKYNLFILYNLITHHSMKKL